MNFIKKYFFYILFTFFLILVIFFTYKNYGITWDEFYYLNIGKYYVLKLFNFFDMRVNLTPWDFPFKDMQLKAHGVIFDIIAFFLTIFLKEFKMESYHLIKALMAIPTFLLIGLTVEKISNKIRLALMAMVLLFLFPRFYGNIFNNNPDIQTTLTVALAVYYFIFYLKSGRTMLQQILLGLVLALAASQRFLLIYLYFLEIGILLFTQKLKALKEIGIISLSTLVLLHLFQPYLLEHPFLGLIDMVRSSNKFPWDAKFLFEGIMVESTNLPLYYLPKFMLITIPITTIFLFFVGHFAIINNLFKVRKRMDKIISLFLLAVFYIPLVSYLIFRPIIYDSWRHFLFLTAPIIIISSFGLELIFQLKNKGIKFLILIILVVNLLTTTKKMVNLHPYQYIYFNEFVGGLHGAGNLYETDYWGAALKEAVEWFNKNINQENQKYIIRNGAYKESTEYYFKKNMSSTDDISISDYCIMTTRWQAHLLCQGKPIYAVTRENTPLVYIYKSK